MSRRPRPTIGRSLLPPARHALVAAALAPATVRRLGWRKAARWVGYVLWLKDTDGTAGDVRAVWRAVRPADLERGGALDPFYVAGLHALRQYAGHVAGDPYVWMVRLWPVIKELH